MPNPDHMKNLRPFPKGHKLGGRKKGSKNMSTILKRILSEEMTVYDAQGKPHQQMVMEQVIKGLIKPALEGSIAHIREIWDRSEGKPSQKIENNTTLAYEPDFSMLTREQLDNLYAQNQSSEEEYL